MESNTIEHEIRTKAKEWVGEFGADFLVELIGDYLDDAAARLARMQQAVAASDAKALMLEAHTLKSSSANLGALGLSAIAKRLEEMARAGNLAAVAGPVKQFAEQFTLVKASLEKLREAPDEYIAQER